MRKIVTTLVAVALILALGVAAMAEGWPMYVTQDGVKVYKKADKGSKVLTKMNGNDKVTVLEDNGKWSKISFKLKGKKKTGWIQDKFLSDDPVPSKCKHKWGDWEVVERATCTQKGVKGRYCKKCGIMEEKEVPKLEHDYGKWKVTKEATCTKKGEKVRVCGYCGHEQVKEIPKAEHNYGKWKVTKEPTCTATGSRYRVCKDCDYKDEQKMDKLPHDFGEWTVLEEATCTATGLRTHTCEDCGYEEEKVIDKLAHQYKWQIVEEATDHSAGTRARICKVCGFDGGEESYDPEGTLRRADRGDEVKALQQLLVDQGYLNAGGADGVYGGGTEKAVTAFQKDQSLEPDGVAWPQTQKRLQHEFGPWETVKALTRAEDGLRQRVCVDCGLVQTEAVEAVPTFERKARGEGVRALQQMLGELGYPTGSYDGIYGQKLDTSFEAFAADNGFEYQAGKVCPADVDALMNAWIATVPADQWMGESDVDSPVNIALTVIPVSEGDEDAEMRTYSWTLTNLGSKKCVFTALLLTYGDAPDFTRDNLTLVLDGFELKANSGNSASGTFSVARAWGEGNLNFAALAVDEGTGAKWLSNAVAFNSALSEAE